MGKIIGIVAAIVVIVGALILWPDKTVAPTPTNDTTQGARGMSVEDYVKQNITLLSPVSANMGGTFYVTEISVGDDGTGVVHYEDGHMAYVADFTYTREPNHGALTITSFTLRQE